MKATTIYFEFESRDETPETEELSMSNIKAPELIAHLDVYGSQVEQWMLADGPEMGPGEDIYLLGPYTRRGYVNIDGDDVRVEIVHDNERKPPQIYRKTLADIAEFATGTPAIRM